MSNNDLSFTIKLFVKDLAEKERDYYDQLYWKIRGVKSQNYDEFVFKYHLMRSALENKFYYNSLYKYYERIL